MKLESAAARPGFPVDFFTLIPPKANFYGVLPSADCWTESLNLLSAAEAPVASAAQNSDDPMPIVRRRGILRPALSMKNLTLLKDNAQSCLASCRIETLDKDAAQSLIPGTVFSMSKFGEGTLCFWLWSQRIALAQEFSSQTLRPRR